MVADQLSRIAVGDDAAAEAVARQMTLAFGFPIEGTRRWVDLVERENWRVLGGTASPLAMAGLVPMAQYVGGRSVSMTGIAGVAVPPEGRGKGSAKRMMSGVVRELHESGVALSVLYSALHQLYRAVGYETSGTVHLARVPAAMLATDDRGAGWRGFVEADDLPGVRACYERFAIRRHGYVDRGGYIWDRVQRPRQEQTEGFLCEDDAGGVEAYVFYRLGDFERTEGGTGSGQGMEMRVTDLAWAGERGLRRLMAFLYGYSSIVGEIVFQTPVESALLLSLPDRRFRVGVIDRFMTRVTNFECAMTERGYRAGAPAEVHIELVDGVVAEQSGEWVVRVDDEGNGSCERGGRGDMVIPARWLGPLYMGHASAVELSDAGFIKAGPTAALGWDRVFRGFGASEMVDMF